ncbi:uncharacterized protein GARIN2 [Dromaius novaehollandiae]|uniref:uncharacterized protein GARIN2 n=1 Tax=Dromaius novaehollandiae TaxID=8790 RepID=UPI0031200E9D
MIHSRKVSDEKGKSSTFRLDLQKRDNAQDVPSPKTEEEKVSKNTSSKQVPLSGIVDPNKESGRKEVAFHGSLKATRQGTTMVTKNKGDPDAKKSKSKDKRKARTSAMKQKSEKKLQTSD